MSELKVAHQEVVIPNDPEPRLKRQVLAYNKKLMLVRHLMRKGWQGVRHSHPHDQLVYVIKGHLHFAGGQDTFEPKAGDSFVIPGGAGAIPELHVSWRPAARSFPTWRKYRQRGTL